MLQLTMDSRYNHQEFEQKMYQKWESAGCFNPDKQVNIDPHKKPYSIILPPPNANDPLHSGHALYVVEDILIRYHRLLGHPTLWLPGTDHAGIETQFVFEKKLKEKGQSRFDFDRNTLYQMIFNYVEENSNLAVSQLKRLGFALDWSRLRFTLDPDHIRRVYTVFKKLHQDGLVYRDEKIINYCTHCGTGFSNLEIDYKTVSGKLYYLNYGPLNVATTRPETMLGDTAVVVNPSDSRYQKLIGTKIKLPLANREIPIIADSEIDPNFGTGAVKVTPSHSLVDYELAKRHSLQFIRIFDYDGLSNQNVPEKYQKLYPQQLRQLVLEELQSNSILIKEEEYTHEVGHCYKCGRVIEPITSPQWFVKTQPLADAAKKAISDKQVAFFPDRFKTTILEWLDNIKDWPISRQIIWGHRIPIWYNLDQNPSIRITFVDAHKQTITGTWQDIQKNYSIDEVGSGLQSMFTPVNVTYYLSFAEAAKSSHNVLQETDTFDTWFSSGQWPYSTLGWEDNTNPSPDFLRFYPTSVLDTMWDILFFWVARMLMLGIYTTKQVPFKTVHLHSRVVDEHGRKMSKSKGNVIEPITVADKYGADSLRFALVHAVSPASDISLSDDKIKSSRNFVNKIWNAARFILLLADKYPDSISESYNSNEEIVTKLESIIQSVTQNLETFHFGQATINLYDFFWHDFCDTYLEKAKLSPRESLPVLSYILYASLRLLHPFLPFVTEAIYQELNPKLHFSSQALLADTPWPTV